MDELVARIAEKVGLDAETARKAIAIVLNFLLKEGPESEVRQLIAALPGAEAAMAEVGDNSKGGGLAGLVGGLMGSGIMALGGQLTAAGLSMGQMQSLGRELFAYGREHAGEDVMGPIVGAVPGLSQFV
ncbi:DUF2267 domain-containing protein [Chelatococcus composti]|jgi:hypothetical protein|uniref:DUF2267 domain-containing protein n=1 Tax=Chelatococcus composti TaxID=1743235 RepID=A0A841KDD4_9HYPH|nr:DUF2267 domain-containing protein [Chelatococcus composti]MBB6169372.1 hypothetical protein [Chelatococcus composti]MBS7736940.1 DUF2267 domain-containing protein [Chelatococcus composti]PZN42334.1 MAG: hypothetical protein DIU59_07815 [Pseudomonadota bacterium]GGG47251.1 hypothetical protein GCM10008026_30580 [Chelatococcus composti]